jgi:hypothetical protein
MGRKPRDPIFSDGFWLFFWLVIVPIAISIALGWAMAAGTGNA